MRGWRLVAAVQPPAPAPVVARLLRQPAAVVGQTSELAAGPRHRPRGRGGRGLARPRGGGGGGGEAGGRVASGDGGQLVLALLAPAWDRAGEDTEAGLRSQLTRESAAAGVSALRAGPAAQAQRVPAPGARPALRAPEAVRVAALPAQLTQRRGARAEHAGRTRDARAARVAVLPARGTRARAGGLLLRAAVRDELRDLPVDSLM